MAERIREPADIERAAAYRWLSGLFAREQTETALATYAAEDGAALLAHLGELPGLAPAAGALAALARDGNRRARVLDLAGAYARLFHGFDRRRAAPPCASFYLEETAVMMGEAAGAAAVELARLDLRLTDDFSEPPDHVAVLLAAMAALVETGDPAAEAAHLDRRLLPWIGEFRDRCAAGDPHGFYAIAARGLADFIETDRRGLTDRA